MVEESLMLELTRTCKKSILSISHSEHCQLFIQCDQNLNFVLCYLQFFPIKCLHLHQKSEHIKKSELHQKDRKHLNAFYVPNILYLSSLLSFHKDQNHLYFRIKLIYIHIYIKDVWCASSDRTESAWVPLSLVLLCGKAYITSINLTLVQKLPKNCLTM